LIAGRVGMLEKWMSVIMPEIDKMKMVFK